MYKYKQTTDIEVGDLVVWTDPSSPSRILKNKPYRVTSTSGTIVAVQDELGSTSCYGSVSRKTLFTKPAEQAAVGDYMYRITSGSNAFPQHSVIKITQLSLYGLDYADGYGVGFDEVIVIAQAEPEVKYPYFTESKGKGREYICKVLDENLYMYVLNCGTYKNYSKVFYNPYPPSQAPCDFTTEPEVFDIDWWQQRYEAGLPVYVTDFTGTYLCGGVGPQKWINTNKNITFGMTDHSLIQKTSMSKEDIELFKQQVPLSTLHLGLCNEISLGATADCSLPYPTIKEQPMKLQQLLDTIFGVSDYEAKPKFIVTVFNNDKEVATTTAESIEEIQQTIQSDTRLWGCKLVAYKIHSELQTQVPVAITKFKKETNASGE